ncbi:MAG: Calx-beta domain-containing protein, partial [Desulfobacterales bacterium]|nr:Calx-beta domain-containing protein [Desulfobacterales bacterium]
MKPTLTSRPKNALWWIIAGLLIALMPSVAPAGDLQFELGGTVMPTPNPGEVTGSVFLSVRMTSGTLPMGEKATVGFKCTPGSPAADEGSGNDYTCAGTIEFDAASGPLVGGPSGPQGIVAVSILGDSIVESDEKFTVEIDEAASSTTEMNGAVPYNVTAGTGSQAPEITILDNDSGATVDIQTLATATEGTNATATFALTLGSTPVQAGETVDVYYTLSEGSATLGSDFS